MKNKKLISYISHIIESQDFSVPAKVNLIGGVMEIFSATSLEPQAQEKRPQEKRPQENKTEKKQKIVSTARYWKYKTEQDPNSKPKGEKIRMSIKRGPRCSSSKRHAGSSLWPAAITTAVMAVTASCAARM